MQSCAVYSILKRALTRVETQGGQTLEQRSLSAQAWVQNRSIEWQSHPTPNKHIEHTANVQLAITSPLVSCSGSKSGCAWIFINTLNSKDCDILRLGRGLHFVLPIGYYWGSLGRWLAVWREKPATHARRGTRGGRDNRLIQHSTRHVENRCLKTGNIDQKPWGSKDPASLRGWWG